jgi:MATE family multidrug resistance protein
MAGPEASSSLTRRFLRLSALNALANLSVPLAGLADAGMLGHLRDLRHLGGVALASVLFDFIYWTFGFLRMGTTGTAAQARGRGDRPELYRVLYRSLLLAAGVAAAVLALQVPLRELGFSLLQGEPEVEAAGRAYFGARIWAAPATLANFAFLGWFLGREESGRALILTVAANASNIAFNYWLIIHLGWNAYGAGLGRDP